MLTETTVAGFVDGVLTTRCSLEKFLFPILDTIIFNEID